MVNKKNIILTGIPRSGTTLTCYLLNKIDDTVALVEPLNPQEFATLSDSEFIISLDSFFEAQRDSILLKKIASSRGVGGKVTDNVVSKPDQKTGRRVKIIDSDSIYIEKELSDRFFLFLKHPSFFSAKLDVLKKKYECYAVIRNPLSILLSWNSVEMAVTNGHAPAAENNDPHLEEILSLQADKMDRQLVLLSWFYEQYFTNLSRESVIKYEDIIYSNGACLEKIVGKMFPGDAEQLSSRNNNSIYNSDLKVLLRNRLLLSEGAYWNYYDRSAIEF
uniref:Sulfotransferase domain-containing protein n=1 Tax=uncultured Thiotrichaceae bacterium TaxID=298394 RepID=A0A6S6U9C8_9GAMM|nr:MAG: Unknown protein [uncultured Thiotrichaceae bacterium]